MATSRALSSISRANLAATATSQESCAQLLLVLKISRRVTRQRRVGAILPGPVAAKNSLTVVLLAYRSEDSKECSQGVCPRRLRVASHQRSSGAPFRGRMSDHRHLASARQEIEQWRSDSSQVFDFCFPVIRRKNSIMPLPATENFPPAAAVADQCALAFPYPP